MSKFRWTKDTPFSNAGDTFESYDNHLVVTWEDNGRRFDYSQTYAQLIADGWLEPADKPRGIDETKKQTLESPVSVKSYFPSSLTNNSAMRNLSDVKEGDLVSDPHNQEVTVLAVTGKLVALSYPHAPLALDYWTTIESLGLAGYKLLTDTQDDIHTPGHGYTAEELDGLRKAECLTPEQILKAITTEDRTDGINFGRKFDVEKLAAFLAEHLK